MIDEIVQSGLSQQLIVFILAAIPVAELRGSLPVGVEIFGLSWYSALFLSILGNIMPVPFILKFLDTFSRLISRNKKGRQFMEWVYQRTRRQTGTIKKYRHLGLIVFVAIPLPGTGAWTASIAAHLLDIKFWPALLDITLGVIGAGIIVTGLVLLGWVGASIATVVMIGIVLLSVWRRLKRKSNSPEKT